MTPTRTTHDDTRPARIELIDGTVVLGRVRSPRQKERDLVVEDVDGASDVGRIRRLPVDSVAYIAYQEPNGPTTRRAHDQRVPVRVCLGHARTILVLPTTSLGSSFGFYATPLDGDDEELFFFAHAVDRVELDDPIGSMFFRRRRSAARD